MIWRRDPHGDALVNGAAAGLEAAAAFCGMG